MIHVRRGESEPGMRSFRFLEFGSRYQHLLEFYNEWEQFNPFSKTKWNWMSFHVMHIYFENDAMLNGFEAVFIVLGLGIRLRLNFHGEDYCEAEKECVHCQINRSAEEIKTGKTKLISSEELFAKHDWGGEADDVLPGHMDLMADEINEGVAQRGGLNKEPATLPPLPPIGQSGEKKSKSKKNSKKKPTKKKK